MAYRNYAPANGFIVSQDGTGDFTTISAAFTAASSYITATGKNITIFVKPGVYTENPTGVAGVDLVAFVGDESNPNVILNGQLNFSGSGTCSISGISLQTNNNFFLVVSGSAASIINLNSCYLNCLNNTGISFTSSSSSATININNCNGNLATTGIAYWNSSSTGSIICQNAFFSNTGNSQKLSMNSAGTVYIYISFFVCGLETTGTGAINVYSSIISAGPGGTSNFVPLVHNGTGISTAYNINLLGGTAASLSIGFGATLNGSLLFNGSSAANSITGSGTLNLGATISSNSSGINATLTTMDLVYGRLRSTTQPAFEYYLSSSPTNVTGDNTIYQIPFNTQVFDQASNFNSSTGTFTAPVAGRYFFSASCQMTAIGAGHTGMEFYITGSSGGIYFLSELNSAAVASATDIIISGAIFISMAANETAVVNLGVFNSTKTVGVTGGLSTTRFSGYLVC